MPPSIGTDHDIMSGNEKHQLNLDSSLSMSGTN